MNDVHTLSKAFDDFEASLRGAPAAVSLALPAGISPCQVWHNVRGTVDAIIAALRAIGTLFPIAKRAADVLEVLKTLLNQLCP